jgi:hypothetical protein
MEEDNEEGIQRRAHLGLAWVIIVFDFPKVPLLCKEGLGEVEVWRKHIELHPALVTMSTTLPHLNPPLTKGRTLIEWHF